MEKENKISLTISAEDMQAVQGAIATLQDKLMPLLVQLDADDRREINKMGDKTVAFVTKAYEHATQNPDLVPSYMDLAEMKIDLDAVETLRQLGNPLEQLTQFINDSRMLAGSEALREALVFYNAVKGASKVKIGASQQIYDDLSARFPSRNRKPKP
jgi:hypothetical protein